MSGKVTVTKEVAEAIGHFRNPDGYDWSNGGIMHEHFSVKDVDCEYRIALRESDTDELMSALVNGYDVEKTPEEKVREYYEGFEKCLAEHAHEYAGVRQGVRNTLNLLGIIIEGVNG